MFCIDKRNAVHIVKSRTVDEIENDDMRDVSLSRSELVQPTLVFFNSHFIHGNVCPFRRDLYVFTQLYIMLKIFFILFVVFNIITVYTKPGKKRGGANA